MSDESHAAVIREISMWIWGTLFKGRRSSLIAKLVTEDTRYKTANEIMAEQWDAPKVQQLFVKLEPSSHQDRLSAFREALGLIAVHPDFKVEVNACHKTQERNARNDFKTTADGRNLVGAR